LKKITSEKAPSREFIIVKFSFKLSEIAKLSHVFNGEDYITFEVAKLKNTDSFGHGYTAYVNKLVETPEPKASLVEDAPKKAPANQKERQLQNRSFNFPGQHRLSHAGKHRRTSLLNSPNSKREPWKQGFFFGHEFAFSLMAPGNEKA